MEQDAVRQGVNKQQQRQRGGYHGWDQPWGSLSEGRNERTIITTYTEERKIETGTFFLRGGMIGSVMRGFYCDVPDPKAPDEAWQ